MMMQEKMDSAAILSDDGTKMDSITILSDDETKNG